MAQAQRLEIPAANNPGAWHRYLAVQDNYALFQKIADRVEPELDMTKVSLMLKKGSKKEKLATCKTLTSIIKHPKAKKIIADNQNTRQLHHDIITNACVKTLQIAANAMNKLPKQERLAKFKDYKWRPRLTNPLHHDVEVTYRNMYGIHGAPFAIGIGIKYTSYTASAAAIGAVLWGTNPTDKAALDNVHASADLSGISAEARNALSNISHPVERIVAQGLLKEFGHPSQQNGLTALIHSSEKFDVPIILPATFMKIESTHCRQEQTVKSSNTPQGCFQFSKNRWLETLWKNAKAYPNEVVRTASGDIKLSDIRKNHLKSHKGVIRLQNEVDDRFIDKLRYDPQASADVKIMEMKRKYPDIIERYQYEDAKITNLQQTMMNHSLGNAFKHVVFPVWKGLENIVSNGNVNSRYDQVIANQLYLDAMAIYQDHQQGATGKRKFNEAALSENPSDVSQSITAVMSYAHAKGNPLFYKKADVTVGEAKARMEAVMRGVVNNMREGAIKNASPSQINYAKDFTRFQSFTKKLN